MLQSLKRGSIRQPPSYRRFDFGPRTDASPDAYASHRLTALVATHYRGHGSCVPLSGPRPTHQYASCRLHYAGARLRTESTTLNCRKRDFWPWRRSWLLVFLVDVIRLAFPAPPIMAYASRRCWQGVWRWKDDLCTKQTGILAGEAGCTVYGHAWPIATALSVRRRRLAERTRPGSGRCR